MADVNLSAAVEAISAGKAPLRLTDGELQTLSDGARQVPRRGGRRDMSSHTEGIAS